MAIADSMDGDIESKKRKFRKLLNNKPLCHPGVSSIAHHDYDHAPPPHLRRVYGKVYKSLKTDEPVPDKIAALHPREHGKSEACTVVIPAWAALDNPNIRILIISETSTQARKKLGQAKQVIKAYAPKYGRKVKRDKQTEFTLHRDVNHAEPTIESAGMGTSITGGHYDVIIFDDICSWENQRTAGQREKVRNQFKDYMNLGSEGESTFIVIGTRKHKNDLYQGLINNPVWDVAVEKAISDWSVIEEKEYDVVLYNSDTGESRTIGADNLSEMGIDETVVDVEPHRNVDVLWPNRWPLNKLIKEMLSTMLEEDESPLVWRRENQNDPTVMEGKVLSLDMLDYVDELPKEHDQYSWFAGLDPAVVEDPEDAIKNDTDYWGLALIASDRLEGKSFLYDVWRKRGMTLKAGIDWMSECLQPYDVGNILAEGNQAQRWLKQAAKDKGVRVQTVTSSGSKEQRIISMASQFESGKVKIVSDGTNSTKWQSFEEEWVTFPSGEHDDRLDGVEIALRNTGGSTVSKSKHELGDLFG